MNLKFTFNWCLEPSMRVPKPSREQGLTETSIKCN